MKFKVTMKDPDALGDAIHDAVHAEVQEEIKDEDERMLSKNFEPSGYASFVKNGSSTAST